MIKKAKLKMDQLKKIVDISRCIADVPVNIQSFFENISFCFN